MLSFSSYKLDDVLGMGFFEAHRLWHIQDELHARNLEHLSFIQDLPHNTEDRRKEIAEWMRTRQPRAGKQARSNLPPEVREYLREVMADD